jgi:hypothetical protein
MTSRFETDVINVINYIIASDIPLAREFFASSALGCSRAREFSRRRFRRSRWLYETSGHTRRFRSRVAVRDSKGGIVSLPELTLLTAGGKRSVSICADVPRMQGQAVHSETLAIVDQEPTGQENGTAAASFKFGPI